jgi:hypothetical protein
MMVNFISLISVSMIDDGNDDENEADDGMNCSLMSTIMLKR